MRPQALTHVRVMKRQRSTSKAQSSSREEPPKKVKKIKAAVPTTLGSLPLYGEQLPENGSADIQPAAAQVCAQLREVMERVRELKQSGAPGSKSEIEGQRQKGMVLFTVLKKLNRLSHLYCKDTREQTHEQKLEVDDLHLQLQNLMYEAVHLRKEITNCLEFKSQHEDIDLISEEEFYSSAPNSITRPDITRTDEHQRMLCRLEWELAQRKQLAEQQSKLESDIIQQELEITTKEDALSSLQPALDGLKKATLPIQQLLGMPFDHIREQEDLALLLPPPLYIVYMQARAYSKVEDSTLSVSIVGEASDARSFRCSRQLEQSDEDSGDSDAEGGKEESSRRRKKRRKRGKTSSSQEQRDVTRSFPLTITLSFALRGTGTLHISLSYLPHFNAICAAITSISLDGITDKQQRSFLDKSSLLHCLFDGDTGRTSPNSVVSSLIRKLGGDNFSLAVKQHGFPYKWLQRACGISLPAESPDSASLQPLAEVSAEFIGTVVKAVKRRFLSQGYLTRQVLALDEQHLVLPPALSGSSVQSQLVQWKQITVQDTQGLSFGSMSVLNLQERTNRFYLATLQLSGGTLTALVCVGTSYPDVPPCFAIAVEYRGKRETNSIQIKNLETEINIRLPPTLDSDKDGQYLLCCQLLRLQECFDVYMEYVGSSAKQRAKLQHKIRGRGRLILFNSE